MLNLMRFRETSLDGNGSGWDAYLRYSSAHHQADQGARAAPSSGPATPRPWRSACPTAHRWDYVALVRYPSRAAFLDHDARRPNTRVANVERENGCAAHAIVAMRETYNKLGPTLKEETMSLEEKLAATRAVRRHPHPAGRQAIMHRATEDLRHSGILDRIVPVGSRMPAFELDNHDGRRVSSAELLAGGPMVLSFFRGSW